MGVLLSYSLHLEAFRLNHRCSVPSAQECDRRKKSTRGHENKSADFRCRKIHVKSSKWHSRVRDSCFDFFELDPIFLARMTEILSLSFEVAE